MMLATGVLNVCPAGLFLGRPVNGEKLILSFDRVDAVTLSK
jgi:hypothetical protein